MILFSALASRSSSSLYSSSVIGLQISKRWLRPTGGERRQILNSDVKYLCNVRRKQRASATEKRGLDIGCKLSNSFPGKGMTTNCVTITVKTLTMARLQLVSALGFPEGNSKERGWKHLSL